MQSRPDSTNGIAVHADTNNHEVDWDAAKVFEKHQTKKKMLESLQINKIKVPLKCVGVSVRIG